MGAVNRINMRHQINIQTCVALGEKDIYLYISMHLPVSIVVSSTVVSAPRRPCSNSPRIINSYVVPGDKLDKNVCSRDGPKLLVIRSPTSPGRPTTSWYMRRVASGGGADHVIVALVVDCIWTAKALTAGPVRYNGSLG